MTGQRTSSATARAANPELARAREYLADLGSRLRIDGTTGTPSSSRIFDAGLLGLEFFRLFGPSYGRLRGKRFSFQSDILTRYNAQREIAFATLRADAERFTGLFATMTETDLDYRNSASSLFSYWQGDAADRARGRLTDFLTSAGSVWARINGFGDILRTACRVAEQIALDKSTAVLGLAASTVGGLAAKDVELLVEVAAVASTNSLTNDQLVGVADLAELTIAPSVCRTSPQVLNMVLDSAQEWLDEAFAPYYEARFAVFEAACDRAQADLDLVWSSVRTALGELTTHSIGTFDRQRPAPPTATTTAQPIPAAPTAAPPPVAPPPVAPAPASPQPDHPDAHPVAVPGGSIAERLGAGPGASSAQVGGLDQGASATPRDDGQQNHDDAHPTADPDQAAGQPAAPAYGGGGGSFLPPPRMAPGGNEDEHRRKVPLKGNPVPDDPAPIGVIGGADDPVAYNEAQQFDDDSPLPRQPVVADEIEPIPEEKKEPAATVWRLTEDGELESVMISKTQNQ